MPVPESYRVELGACASCSKPLNVRGYRARSDWIDAQVTRFCQACMDSVYLGVDQEDGRVLPIFDGTLVAVRALATVHEVAFIPFRLVVPGPSRAHLVWNAAHITRASPWLDSINLANELDPMAGLLYDHQVGMQEYRTFDAPQLTQRLASLRFLIGLDRRSLDAVRGVCSMPDGLQAASLAEEVPWIDLFGRPLRPLDTWRGPEPQPLSTLRIAAVMGLLLMEQGRDRRRPLDHLIDPRSEFFEESSDALA